jgi:hypothetical protein
MPGCVKTDRAKRAKIGSLSSSGKTAAPQRDRDRDQDPLANAERVEPEQQRGRPRDSKLTFELRGVLSAPSGTRARGGRNARFAFELRESQPSAEPASPSPRHSYIRARVGEFARCASGRGVTPNSSPLAAAPSPSRHSLYTRARGRVRALRFGALQALAEARGD